MTRKCVARLLVSVVLAVVTLTGGAPAQIAWSPWNGPWDYSVQVGIHPECAGLDLDEFSHAALIPDGDYQGKVLLWRFDRAQTPPDCSVQDTTTAWVFDPIHPTELLRISQTLASDIFCSGLTWDHRGQLVVAGGLGGGQVPRETYRFRPNALGQTTMVGTYPEIQYNTSFPPWHHLLMGDMSLPRYYPTLITLFPVPIGTITSDCGVSAGSIMALGGPPCGPCNEGNEFWEFLGPTAPSWSCQFRPPVGVIDPAHLAYIQATSEEYSLHPTSNPPSHRFDSYPRALQLSTGHVFVAFDVDSSTMTPPNIPGESWGIALMSALFPGQPDSRLWHMDDTDSDRNYAPAILMETRTGTQVTRNRVLIFGGSDGVNMHNSVKELVLGQQPGDPVNVATWQAKQPMLEARHQSNAVILPTRQILITGGARSTHVPPLISGPGQGPVLRPELYDPGPSPTGAQTPGQLVPAGNARLAIDQVSTNPTPRVYHHVSLLLPDGRVLILGGESSVGFQPQIYPEAKYSAEIFSPPYLQQAGFKPVFNTAPSGPFRVNAPGTEVNRFTLDVSLSTTVSTSLDTVVLIRAGAVTHHFDYSQRYIELKVSSDVHQGAGQHLIEVVSPEYTSAPLGWYMLFVLERDNADPTIRIPSVAKFIRLEL